ncbi:MAG: D-glycero-beta-D-manno-heptose 1,7-bisphosphate 7-phosphatase [Gammaproteobacteria bacterium]|nr:D-glycero-beta-D-manno-heptose 1,7-bisphosphate 7-phosphatase [Gammaproteobacteria bacterium]
MVSDIKKLVILDRDGVINHDSDDYIKSPDEWIPIDGSLEAISLLNKHGVLVAIASNQSGIARGLFSENTLESIHIKMINELEKLGGKIDSILFCPDHPENACHYRKPNPGMLLKHMDDFNVLADNTWFVGDSISDIQCAKKANCHSVLVLTGKGKLYQNKIDDSVSVYNSLSDFVEHFID